MSPSKQQIEPVSDPDEFAGHTPGPWIIATSNSYRRILRVCGKPVCYPVTQRSDGHPDLQFPHGGENGPDARLIAAAPELLAERDALRAENRRLKLLVQSAYYEGYTFGSPEEPHDVSHRWRNSAARAALEGKSNET